MKERSCRRWKSTVKAIIQILFLRKTNGVLQQILSKEYSPFLSLKIRNVVNPFFLIVLIGKNVLATSGKSCDNRWLKTWQKWYILLAVIRNNVILENLIIPSMHFGLSIGIKCNNSSVNQTFD